MTIPPDAVPHAARPTHPLRAWRETQQVADARTGKVRPMPIMLFGKDFWERVIDFKGLAEEGVISPGDLDLIQWCETAQDAWDYVSAYYPD